MIEPKFSYSDVKFAEDESIFSRAKNLYRSGRVKDLIVLADGYQAVVMGTSPYRVRLSSKRIDYADCDCYMGQNDQLCKHVLALALAVLAECGGVTFDGEPTARFAVHSVDARDHIAAGLRYIRSYDGPSRIWFEYQRKLDIAAGMITEGVEALETTKDNAKYLWRLVLKLSKKLSDGGVDDSNGTIGGAIFTVMERLVAMAAADPAIYKWAIANCHEDTGFEFERELLEMLKICEETKSVKRS